jgi:hypothetical protein
MKASDLYAIHSAKVDELQRALRNHVTDQIQPDINKTTLSLVEQLTASQDIMKRMMALGPDRELTGDELLMFQVLPGPNETGNAN